MTARYGPFGRENEFRSWKVPQSPIPRTYVDEQSAAIFRKITRLIIPLVQHPDVMDYWRDQVKTAGTESSGGVDSLPKAYFILARIHDRWGGLKKIITTQFENKIPADFKVSYKPIDCPTYLKTIQADLEQKGLGPYKVKPGHKPKRGKGRPKIPPESPEGKIRIAVHEGLKRAKEAGIETTDYCENINKRGIEIDGEIHKKTIDERYIKQCADWYRDQKKKNLI